MPPNETVGFKSILFLTLLIQSISALQQPYRHGHPSRALASDGLGERASASALRWRNTDADSLHASSLGGQRESASLSEPQGAYRDTHVEKQRTRSNTQTNTYSKSNSNNERALATLSPPAESHPAVRAPSAPRSSVATAGLSSRQPARSLQDWQVEDIVLLATVDGSIHARDRKTGAPKWQLETERPMVETTYHRPNRSVDENGLEYEDPLWIVEPSQDGSIYLYAPGSGLGMQKLGYTVKQLADMAPYSSDGHPAVTYTAEKKTTLFTVDAATGHILKRFSSAGSHVNQDRSCRRVNPLESLDEEECEPIGTLTLGRTEYSIGVQDLDTGEPISTIRYFEWGPNNRDQDLTSKYTHTMDRKYVYTKYDGTVFGLDLASNDYYATSSSKPIYRQKLSSPVARIYDLVRPQDDISGDASLVVLPQPIGPSPNIMNELDTDYQENVFVNCTPGGSFYALSERNYPTVTEGASTAKCYGDELWQPSFSWPMSKMERDKFTGVHQLSASSEQIFETPSLDSPHRPGIDPPPEYGNQALPNVPLVPPKKDTPSLRSVILACVLALTACGFFYREQLGSKIARTAPTQSATTTPELLVPATNLEKTEQPEQPLIREAEPAEETIFPRDESNALVTKSELEPADQPLDKLESNDAPVEDDVKGADDNNNKDAAEPRKRKATRGKRGGKKAKEKENQQAEYEAKKKGLQVPQPSGIISVAASEGTQVPGPLQINSLIIHTDKAIGQGSCGTSVFEGTFEGRAVAVKRMLAQYYELHSQEVSFLQQNDDHPNVIRYYCQQKDEHFLYIAVELCQASLFEVWESEKARTEERQLQLSGLKLSIQQDMLRTLQQLADGLYHLHRRRIIHRDIKPQNILVAFPKRHDNKGPQLVISDFGLGKNLPENASTLVDPTGNAGTSGWKAPELISQPKETENRTTPSHSHTGGSEPANGSASGVKRAADIFSLGCLFFWVLTDGIHPFEDENGWPQLRELNIKKDNKKLGVLQRWSDAFEPMQLITSMLAHQPEDRPTALQVMNHPFFWSAERRLAFLCDCSDHFEREPRGVWEDNWAGDSPLLQLLEDRAEEVIGAPFARADFLSKLDRHFVDTLGKQRKYNGNRLLDLLRALRNKKNHYEDMPEDVKRRVGPLAGGYLNFWCNRFPRLLMACHEVVYAAGLEASDRFKVYSVPERLSSAV